MKYSIRNRYIKQFHSIVYKISILLLPLILIACNDNNHSSDFKLSNVSDLSILRTGNMGRVSFTLSSNKTIVSAELTYSLVSIEDTAQTYSVGVGTVGFDDLETSIEKIFLIPESLVEGKYRLNVSIEVVVGEQGVVTESETITIAEVDIITPTDPELVVKLAKLNNHSFFLKDLPDDKNQVITKRGDILLDLVLQSKYKALTGNVVMDFELKLDGLGTFPLDLTSRINIRSAGGTDNHRNVTADGKVLERVKGQSRTISDKCTMINETERCGIIGKNRGRHFHIDLHLNEDTFNILNSTAQDVTGKIVGRVRVDEMAGDVEFQLPVVYLYNNRNPKVSKLSDSQTKSSSEEGNVDEIQTTNSGDDEYIYHQTTSSANTFTDSDGQAYSEQSQDVSVSMGYQDDNNDGQTFSMASMTTTVKSDSSEDVTDTEFSMGLDSSGGTIWDFAETAGEPSSANKTVSFAASRESSSSETTSYNPQNEMAWTHCADKKQYCNVLNKGFPGSAQVRFGSVTLDKWKYKIVTNEAKCNNDNFGDPDVGNETKTCQYLPTPSFAPTWERCASEKGYCTAAAEGSAMRYGRNGEWNRGFVYGTVGCDDKTFGDPHNGSDKWCEIMTNSGTAPLDYEWVDCGPTDGTCNGFSSAVVRLGVHKGREGDFYTFRKVRDSITCKGKYFGQPYDSANDKSCAYLRYIDPAARQDETDLTWSTKDDSINLDTNDGTVTEVAGEEEALVEVEFSESMSFRYYGITFEAEVEMSGVVGLKASAFVDTANRTFTLTGGPFIDADASATGKAHDCCGLIEVGIKAPLAVLDMYSPFTIAFTVKPGVLTAEVSLDYFLDLLAGEVILYYKYDDYLFYSASDEEVIYSWNYLYQISENIFKGSQTWEYSPIQDYILPAIPDGFFEQKIGFPSPTDGREYLLELSGTLQNNDVWDPKHPNESVTVDIVCGDNIVESMVFTGNIYERVQLGECSEVIISGIRTIDWAQGNGMSFGLREQ